MSTESRGFGCIPYNAADGFLVLVLVLSVDLVLDSGRSNSAMPVCPSIYLSLTFSLMVARNFDFRLAVSLSGSSTKTGEM